MCFVPTAQCPLPIKWKKKHTHTFYFIFISVFLICFCINAFCINLTMTGLFDITFTVYNRAPRCQANQRREIEEKKKINASVCVCVCLLIEPSEEKIKCSVA